MLVLLLYSCITAHKVLGNQPKHLATYAMNLYFKQDFNPVIREEVVVASEIPDLTVFSRV
jgi:hypothetical protein